MKLNINPKLKTTLSFKKEDIGKGCIICSSILKHSVGLIQGGIERGKLKGAGIGFIDLKGVLHVHGYDLKDYKVERRETPSS